MFDPSQKFTGTDYTVTVALLVAGLVFIPAVLFISSRPVGYLPFSLATACSVICFALAWASWRRTSRLTIPSIEVHEAGTK